MTERVVLTLGALADARYLTVKDLDYDEAAYTLSVSSLRGRLTLRTGATLIAYYEGGKVVSKVVTVTPEDAGKAVLDLAEDLAAYTEKNQPVPEDVTAVVEALTLLRDRVARLESAPSGVTERQVQAIVDSAIAEAGPRGLTETQVRDLISQAQAAAPAPAASGLTEEQVRDLIAEVQAAPATSGLTEAQVRDLIAEAQAAAPAPTSGLTEEQVRALIDAAVAAATAPAPSEGGAPAASGLTEEQVRAIVAEAHTAPEGAVAADAVFDSSQRYYSPVTYFWPDFYKEDSEWTRALRFNGSTGYVILNKNSGEWDAFDADFNTQGERARAAGAKVILFYVKTQYGAAGNAAWQEGVPNPDKFTHEHILSMIRNVMDQYPDLTSDNRWGVFLDEFINGWGAQEERLAWYQELIGKIRDEFGRIYVVGNPGVNVSPDVLALDIDTFMSFEGDADRYVANDPSSPVHPEHMAAEPRGRFWHVVHGVTEANYQDVMRAADSYGVHHLYVTNLTLVENPDNGGQWVPEGNPYATAPGEWLTDPVAAWLVHMTGVERRLTAVEASGGAASPAPEAPAAEGMPLYVYRTARVTFTRSAGTAFDAPLVSPEAPAEGEDLVVLGLSVAMEETPAPVGASVVPSVLQVGRESLRVYGNNGWGSDRQGYITAVVTTLEAAQRAGVALAAGGAVAASGLSEAEVRRIASEVAGAAGGAGTSALESRVSAVETGLQAVQATQGVGAGILVLGAEDPVPEGTPVGTIIIRESA